MTKLLALGGLVAGAMTAMVLTGCSGPSDGPTDAAPQALMTPTALSPQADLLTQADDLASGRLSSAQMTRNALARIDAVDRNGPTVQAVLSVNPDAVSAAGALDDARTAEPDVARGPLYGLPILVKDNIETRDALPTTAGSTALLANMAGKDAPLMAGLRDAGVVMLGKSNLSEWANFRSEDSTSGWSAVGGLTRNPHVLDRSACGSSSGSGAAVAAGIVAAAVGTETDGSISCPASRNGIVGFKPTVGLVAQDGIVPISPTQDTAGPMTLTVTLAAAMLDAMDTADVDYVAQLDEAALSGLRIGVLRFAEGKDAAVSALFADALAVMGEAGAALVDIDSFSYPDGFWDKSYRRLKIEFGPALDAYLATTPDAVTARSLADLIAWNAAHAAEEMPVFDQSIFLASAEEIGLDDPEYAYISSVLGKATRKDGIDALLEQYDVDVLVAPTGRPSFMIDPMNGDQFNGGVGAGSLAAIAGYPHLTVPMGAVHDLPVGLSFIGTAGDDARLLSAGYAYEQLTHKRVEPKFLPSAMVSDTLAPALANHFEPVAAQPTP